MFAQYHSAVYEVTSAKLERTVTPTLCVQNGRADSWRRKCGENLILNAFYAKVLQEILETTTTASELVMARR